MTQGGGFTSGEDFVAARVSIDVPTEGIQSLREMSQAVDRFRTSVEAGSRSSSSFVGYINQIVQAGQQATEMHQNLAAQLERTADIQQRMQTGMPGMSSAAALPLSRSAPQGYVDNFAGMGVGMGGQRGPSPSDVQQQIQQQAIDPTRQLDPRNYINAQAGRYRTLSIPSTPTGAPDWQEHADRIEQRDKQEREQEAKTPGSSPGGVDIQGQVGKFGGLANNIMNEMGPSGSHLGMLNLANRGLGALGKWAGSRASAAAPQGEAGGPEAEIAADTGGGGLFGGLGGLAKGAGAGLGIGLAGFAAVQKGGSVYQGYKNMGLLRGGGAGEGMQSEMAIRGMALNPFLSTEQSRQIIMAGLTEGYSGKQFDTVTQFMAENLKSMNISVSDSVGMLRKNVNEGGQSVQGLASSLALLKGLSQGGVQSLPDLTKNFAATSGALIDAGAPGGPAAQDAILAGQLFGDDHLLAGTGGPMLSGMTPAGIGMMRAMGGANVPRGLIPQEVMPYMYSHGQSPTGSMMNMVKQLVGNFFKTPASRQKGSVDYQNALGILTNVWPTYFGAPMNQAQIGDMVDKVLGGQDLMAQAQGAVDKKNQEVTPPQGFMSNLGDAFGNIGTTLLDAGKEIAGAFTGNETAQNNARNNMYQTWDTSSYKASGAYQNPILNNIVGQYGPGDILVVDKSGNAKPLTGAKDQVQALAKGDLTWKRKGDQGNGISLAQTPLQMDPSFRTGGTGGGNTNVSFSPATVNVNVNTTTGQATASPNVIQLTPNQQAVNAGVGSNTMNNPQPGDGYGYRYTGTGTR